MSQNLISEMYCTNCGNRGINIPRRSGHYRKAGHLKKLYCIHCKKECNHVEIHPFFTHYNYEDFKLEIKYNNFNKNGKRKEPYKIFKNNLRKRGVI